MIGYYSKLLMNNGHLIIINPLIIMEIYGLSLWRRHGLKLKVLTLMPMAGT